MSVHLVYLSSRPRIMPKVGKKNQFGVRYSKKMKRFRGTQKQDVVVRKRKETPAVEVTLISEEDVVKKTNSPLGRLSFEAENTARRP